MGDFIQVSFRPRAQSIFPVALVPAPAAQPRPGSQCPGGAGAMAVAEESSPLSVSPQQGLPQLLLEPCRPVLSLELFLQIDLMFLKDLVVGRAGA